MPTQLNPKTVPHRPLKFNTLDEALAEAERLAQAEREGRLQRTGNWTLGQALGHLAYWINVAYDGYPPELRPPWFVKLILRTMKGRVLRGELPRGARIPKVPGGTLGIDVIPTEEGLARFRKAVARLKAAPPSVPNIVFGPLTHDEWTRMHTGHAQLHLGYMRAE